MRNSARDLWSLSGKSGGSISINAAHGNHKNRRPILPSSCGIKACLIALAAVSWFFCLSERLDALSPATETHRPVSKSFRPEAELPATEVPSGASLLIMERSIERYTNKERAKKGLAPLNRSPALAFLAKNQSRNMCQAGLLIHESDRFPSGWRRFEQRLSQVGLESGGENIAYQTVLKQPENWARLVVQGWMNSPEHRKNILNPEYRYLGVGLNPCLNKIVYATQVFSSKMGRVPE